MDNFVGSNANMESHQGTQFVHDGTGFLLDIDQFALVEGGNGEDYARPAGTASAAQGGRSQSWEAQYAAQSAFSSKAQFEGGENADQSLVLLHTQGQGQSRMQGQGQSADGLIAMQIQQPNAAKSQKQNSPPKPQKVKVNELGQLGTIKNLNKIISSQQNSVEAQESFGILQHVKKFAEIPPRPTGQASQMAKRDTLESHKLYKKQKLHQQQRQEGLAAMGHQNEKDHFQKVLHHLEGPVSKPKSSKSMSGLPVSRKHQKTSKMSLRMNTKHQLAGKSAAHDSSTMQGEGSSSVLLNREQLQEPRQKAKQTQGNLPYSRKSATRLEGYNLQSGSRNTTSLAAKKSVAAPAASSTEKLSQTLGPDSFVDLLKHSNQSFHIKHNLKSQQRGETNGTKIDKIIRKNLRKQKEKDEQKKKEEDAKTMRDLERKQQIQMRNEWVRRLHKEQYQRSRQRRNSNQQNVQPAVTTSLSLKKKITKATLGAVSSKHLLNMTKTSDSTLIELSGVGAERRSRRDDGAAKVAAQAPRSGLHQMRKSQSIQKQSGKITRNMGNNSPRRSGNAPNSQEQVRDQRRAQRTSQERGNQRVLSGMSRGSRSRSGKSGLSAKSGRSAGIVTAQDGSHAAAHAVIAEQRGHLLATQTSAHAGGKKDSINSNFSHPNQMQSSNSRNPVIHNKQYNLMNMQQSQLELSTHQGGALQASQQLDANIVLSRQARDLREHAARESPLRAPGQFPEDLHLRSLEEQLNQISYNNTKNNISQMLHGEHSLEDEMLPEHYLAQLEETTDLKRLNSQKDLSKTQKQHLQGKLRQTNDAAPNAPKAQAKKEGALGAQHTQTHSHDKLTFKSKKGNGLYKHGGSVASGALGLGLPSSGNLMCMKQASQNLQKTLNASSLLLAGVGSSSAHNIGMDFLDVKREILDELRQVDRKAQEKYAKTQRRRQHQLSHKDIQVVDGRMAGQAESQMDFQRTAMIQDSSVQDLRLHGRAAAQLVDEPSQNEALNADIKSCSQTLAKLRSKSSSPIIQKLENEHKKNSRNAQQRFVDAPAGVQKQPGLQAASTVQRLHTQKTLSAVNPQHTLYLKQQLQKFIKRKQKDKKQLEEQEKMEQINDAIRVHENLSKLEQYVQKKAAANSNKTNTVLGVARFEKKPSLERSRSGRRARSKSRERRNVAHKKNTKIKLAEGAGKVSRLSHQNLTAEHQQTASAFDNEEPLSSIKRVNTNNDDILTNTQSNQVLNVNLKGDNVSFFRSDGKRISKSQSRDRIVRVQQQNDSLQNLQPIFSNQNIFEHDSHFSEKQARDGSSKNLSQFNSKTWMPASSNRAGHQSGKLAKKRHKSTNRDHVKRLKPYTSKGMGRALAKSLSLQSKQAMHRLAKDQKLQQNLKKNHQSKKSLHYDSPYSKAKNASSSKSRSRSKSKRQSKQSKTKSKSQSKSNSKQSKSHSRSRKAAKRQLGLGAFEGAHQKPPKPKRSARKDQQKPACKTQKIDLPNMKLQDDQLLEILKKINYDFSKPKAQKKKKQAADQSKVKKNKLVSSTSPPQRSMPAPEQPVLRQPEIREEPGRTAPAPPPAAVMKERQIRKYREERWVVPSVAQSHSQGFLNNHMYGADKIAANVTAYAKATGEESSKEQSLLLQNSRSQQSFTFCDRQSSTFKGPGALAPTDSVMQESQSQKRSLVGSSVHGDRAEQAFQVRNLEMNASSASSVNVAGKLVILDGSRPKIVNNYGHKEESYASCPSGSQSVRSNRSGILAQLKDKNIGVPSLPQLQNDALYSQFLPLPAEPAQPTFSVAESHRSLSSQKIPTSSGKNRPGGRGSQQQPSRKQEEDQLNFDATQIWKQKQTVIKTHDSVPRRDDELRQKHDRKRSQVVSGQSSSIGMHIEVQGVEINDSSRKSETFSGDLMLKFQKFENIHGLNLKAAGVESDYTMPPLTAQAPNDLAGSAKFPETSGDVSKVSPIISQININKTIESKRSQSNSQTDAQIDEQGLSKQAHKKYSRSSHQSGSNNQFKQYKEVSMPQSLHSINSQISQLSIQSQLRKMAQNSSRTSRQGVGVSGLVSSRQAKLSQACAEGQELLMNDLQTYQKHEMAFADDNLGGPTTLISHLNDDQSNDANEFATTTKQIGESQDQRAQHQATDSDINMRGALRSVKRGEELVDDELLSPRNRLDHLSIEAIEGTGGALSTKDIHQSSQQITAENLLKYLDTKYKEKKQENSSVFEHSRASHLSEQHRHSSRKSPIAHTRKLGFNPSSQPPILSDRKPSPHALTHADMHTAQQPACDSTPMEQLNQAQAHLQVQLVGPPLQHGANERQSSPEAVVESRLFVIDQQNQAQQQQMHDEEHVGIDEEEIREEGNQQAVSVLETVEERIMMAAAEDTAGRQAAEVQPPGQSPMRTLNSLKQSDELNKYLDSDIQSDSSRSPGPRLAQEESAQKTEAQQIISGVRREEQMPKQDDDADEQAAEEAAADSGERQEAKEPMSLLEAEQRVQEEDVPSKNPPPAAQPEMNINSDLTTLNFDPDNSSSSDGRGPYAGPAGLLVPGQMGASSEPNYQMFMNAKKADQKCLNQFRRRQKRNQQQSEQQQKQKQELGINVDQIEIDIQENSLKGQSSDQESEHVGQPPTDTEDKYTSRSEGENQEKQQTIFLEDIKFDQDEPKTERNHNLDKLDSDASDEDLFAEQNAGLSGQKIKIADIINRKRKSKKSLSGEQKELVQAQPEAVESSSEVCKSFLNQIIDQIAEPQKKPEETEEEQKPPVKKIVSAAQKEIEVFNPAAAQASANQATAAKAEAVPKEQSVEEYHESLLSQPAPAEAPKISPETSDGKDKAAPAKPPAQLYKELKADEVYELLRASINQGELKHQIRQVIEMKQRQNIERDLIRADSYVNELLEYLLQFEIPQGYEEQEAMLLELNGGVNYLALFLTSLTQPQRREVLEELRKMQTQELGSYSHFESCLDPLQYAILPIDMYLDVEKQRQFTYQLTHQEERREKDLKKQYSSANSAFSAISALSNSITQESQHILHKAIFDAMNESLTKFRPYGMVGEPLPWSNKYRRLQTEVDINSVDTERLFQMVKQEVYRWMSAQQGALTHQRSTVFQYIDLHIPLLPEIEERIHAVEGGDKQLSNYQKLQMQTPKELKMLQEQQITRLQGQMIEESTQDMRQVKLANLLHQEIIEDEHQWLNYEFEETQIRIDLGEMILESLVQETIDFLNSKQKPEKSGEPTAPSQPSGSEPAPE